jgi:asparagine synthase (glutamine-hydrolysing)
MCGLCGEIAFEGNPGLQTIQKVAEQMHSRGPDARGFFAQGHIALGHCRLSIIDVASSSQQPMVDSELGLAVAFNGCIYNYRELRDELEQQGYRFFSDGDTEVILKAYHAWGSRFPERLKGMFAIALWIRESGRVLLIRDRLGIKPLYISRHRDRLRFASTLPALLAAGGVDTRIDQQSLHYFMSLHGTVPSPGTILRGIKKLPPATMLIIEPDGSEHEHRYWDFSIAPSHDTFNAGEWEEAVGEALRIAVKRRLVADVPLGILLSGGLDSSLLVALAAPEAGQLKTYSIGFDDAGGVSGNEFRYSDAIARHFGTDHHKIHIPSDRTLAALPSAIAAMSEPMMSHDAVAFFLLAQEVSRDVKVVQSGQGADEIFGGYHWYSRAMQANDAGAEYKRIYFDRDHDEMHEAIHPDLMNGDYSSSFVDSFLDRTRSGNSIEGVLELDAKVMLVDDPVKRVDNMTMAWGLEARVPFLDHELVELAAAMPTELKVRDGGKHILKRVARNLLPDDVIDRPKGYFPVPFLKHIEGDCLGYIRDILTSKRARERSLFNRAYVDRLLDHPTTALTPKGHSKLWQAAVLEGWLQTHKL